MSKFPLPPDYFRCPPLSPDEIARLQGLGERTSADMVRTSRLRGGPVKWTLASDIDGLQLYAGDDPSAPRGVTSYCAVTEVMGTLDEVAALFKTDTAEGYHEYLRMFGNDHLDGQTLYTLATESIGRPRHHLSLKWSACAMPGFAKPRDWCYLESQHDFATDQGRQGWVRSFKSVKLTCCPHLQTTFNVVRGEYHRSGYVVMESPKRAGYLVAMAVHQIDWKGNIPSFVTASAVRKRCRAVADLDTHLRARRLRSLSFLPMHQLVPFALRVKCFVCCARFGVFGHSKESCRQCGEVVCRMCSRLWDVGTHQDKLHVRICAACSSCATAPATSGAPTPPSSRNSTKIVLGPLPTPSHAALPSRPRQGPQGQHLIYFPMAAQQRDGDGFPTPSNATSNAVPAPPRSTKAREKPRLFEDAPPPQPRSTKARSKPSLFDLPDVPARPRSTKAASSTRVPRTWDDYVDDRGSIKVKPHGILPHVSHGKDADEGIEGENVPVAARTPRRLNGHRSDAELPYTPRLISSKPNAHGTPPTLVAGQANLHEQNQMQLHHRNKSHQPQRPHHGHFKSYYAIGDQETELQHRTPRSNPPGTRGPSRYIDPSPRGNTVILHQSAGEMPSTSQDVVVMGPPCRAKTPAPVQHYGKEALTDQSSTPRNDLIMIEDTPAGENALAVVLKTYQSHANGNPTFRGVGREGRTSGIAA